MSQAGARAILPGLRTSEADPEAERRAFFGRLMPAHAETLKTPFFGQLGAAGVASAPLQLVAAHESANPGEKIVLSGTTLRPSETVAINVSTETSRTVPRPSTPVSSNETKRHLPR